MERIHNVNRPLVRFSFQRGTTATRTSAETPRGRPVRHHRRVCEARFGALLRLHAAPFFLSDTFQVRRILKQQAEARLLEACRSTAFPGRALGIHY
jgi:hypothetical protein